MPQAGPLGPRRDLWPDVAQRIDSRAPGMHWFDWALAGTCLLLLLLFPELIPSLLYHL